MDDIVLASCFQDSCAIVIASIIEGFAPVNYDRLLG
jgi:hypothetical protein